MDFTLDDKSAVAMQAVADAVDALAEEYTDGFHTFPRNRSKAALWQALLDAMTSYSHVVGGIVSARIHREHCGHTSALPADPSPRTSELERQLVVAMTAPTSSEARDGELLAHFARGLTPRQADRVIKLCSERRRDGDS